MHAVAVRILRRVHHHGGSSQLRHDRLKQHHGHVSSYHGHHKPALYPCERVVQVIIPTNPKDGEKKNGELRGNGVYARPEHAKARKPKEQWSPSPEVRHCYGESERTGRDVEESDAAVQERTQVESGSLQEVGQGEEVGAGAVEEAEDVDTAQEDVQRTEEGAGETLGGGRVL